MDATVEQAPQEQTDSTRSPSELFRYSAWLHVGLSADECEDRETGSCRNPLHFHAWCRLPNQFQHQDIRERALAAKARRIRQLRDPDSDAHVILQGDIAELHGQRAAAIDELIAKEWSTRYLEALADVENDEVYEHIERDRDRFRELQRLDEAERPADEYGELERHFRGYSEAIDKRRAELEQPVRDALEGLSEDELVEQVREARIADEGSAAFMDVYAKWQWFAGVYTSADPIARERRFTTLAQLEDAAPEVIEALRETYGELETSLQRGHRGN